MEIAVRLNYTITAEKIFNAAPFNSILNLDEGYAYFGVPLVFGLECPSFEMPRGTVAYWPECSAAVILFDRTIQSLAGRLISPARMTIIGEVVSGLDSIEEIGDKGSIAIRSSK